MNPLTNWLAIICIFAALNGGLYLLRRHVDRQQAEVLKRLNSHNFVVIEADDVDFASIKQHWSKFQWTFDSSARSADGRTLYRFERSMRGAALLGDILLGPKDEAAAEESVHRGGPIKIKETGIKS